jgi:pentapeptide MXKDX repeat protein
MIARILTIAVAATLVLGTATIPTVSFAEMLKKEEPKKDTKKKEEPKKEETAKEPSAQQNKMKACGAEWQAMKKDGRAKGTTYAAFSKECLKKK